MMENTSATSTSTSIEKQIDSFLEHFKRGASRAIEAEWCSANRTASAVLQRSLDSSAQLSNGADAGDGGDGTPACPSPRLPRCQDTGKFRSRSFRRSCQLLCVSFRPAPVPNSCSANTVPRSALQGPRDTSPLIVHYPLCCSYPQLLLEEIPRSPSRPP